jgi:hypothetical protein
VLTPGDSSTVHIYTQTVQYSTVQHSTVQYTFTHKQYTERHKTNNTQNNTKILELCGPCPILASYTLTFALQLEKKHGNPSVGAADQ